MSTEDFIWTGNWTDAREFLDRVGYRLELLTRPDVFLCDDGGSIDERGNAKLHVYNRFTEESEHAEIGDRVRWYSHTRSFQVVHFNG